LADRCLTAVHNELPDVGPSKCEAKRLKAAGKKAWRIFYCNAKAAAANVPVDAACIQHATDKFAAAFAETSGCSGSQATVQARIDDECVADIGADSTGGAFIGTLCETPPAPSCSSSEFTSCGSGGNGFCFVARDFEDLGNCARVC